MSYSIVTDVALSQRLERAEARANISIVEARARLAPESGATWCDVAGTYAMFDQVGSPSTQTFGLGLFAKPTTEDVAKLEAFFEERGAEVYHEVSPLADAAVLALLAARGYHPLELTNVMHRPVAPAGAVPSTPAIRVRLIDAGEAELYAQTAARGWGQSPDLDAAFLEFGRMTIQARGMACFLAEWDGTPIASAAIALHDRAALFAGASTITGWRGRGAQGALLNARLRYAEAQGCDLAVMGAQPGSASQRNAERQGFRIAYTRIKWHRPRTV